MITEFLTKYLKGIFLILVLFSCKSNTENKTDKSIRLFDDGSKLMLTGFKLEVHGSDSSKIYYRDALRKFMDSYLLDTSNLEFAIYLPDLYNKLGVFDSAILWNSKLKPIDSIYDLSNKNHTPTIYGPPQDSTKFQRH